MKWAVLLLLLTFNTSSEAAFQLRLDKGSLEESLFEDARDGKLNLLSIEHAALIASGVSRDDLLKYIQKIDSLYNHIALRWPMGKMTSLQKAKIILGFLHKTVLKTYDPMSTEIQKALDEGSFNCVSSTLLFNILCARFKIETSGIEVPTHLYSAILDPKTKDILFEVQTTIPYGFFLKDFSRNEFIYSPEIETWHGKRRVNPVSLIAVIYYNRGISSIRQKDFARALPIYQKAYILDPQFPNLASLVTELYTGLGNQFFRRQEFEKAIDIYQQGYSYLPPGTYNTCKAALTQNLTAAMINEANQAIAHKQWTEGQRLLKRAYPIGPMQSTILHNLKALYYSWGQDELDRHYWEKALNTYRLARKEFPKEKGFHQNMCWIYSKVGQDLLRANNLKKARAWFKDAYRETSEPNFLKVCEWLKKI